MGYLGEAGEACHERRRLEARAAAGLPFYVLTYVHLALLLMPSAMAGNNVAVLSIAVYSIVMGAYVVLRLRNAGCRAAWPNPPPRLRPRSGSASE